MLRPATTQLRPTPDTSSAVLDCARYRTAPRLYCRCTAPPACFPPCSRRSGPWHPRPSSSSIAPLTPTSIWAWSVTTLTTATAAPTLRTAPILLRIVTAACPTTRSIHPSPTSPPPLHRRPPASPAPTTLDLTSSMPKPSPLHLPIPTPPLDLTLAIRIPTPFRGLAATASAPLSTRTSFVRSCRAAPAPTSRLSRAM